MRNPGESPEGRVQSETSSEGTIVPPSSPMPSFKFSESDLVICNFIAYRNVWFYLKHMLKVLTETNVIVHHVKD